MTRLQAALANHRRLADEAELMGWHADTAEWAGMLKSEVIAIEREAEPLSAAAIAALPALDDLAYVRSDGRVSVESALQPTEIETVGKWLLDLGAAA